MEEPPGANPPPVGRRTLYIRHVPDDVAERLEKLASRAGVPLSTFALQELSETARRGDNADLLNGLPTAAIDPALILVSKPSSMPSRPPRMNWLRWPSSAATAGRHQAG